jgi:hypothetical protein
MLADATCLVVTTSLLQKQKTLNVYNSGTRGARAYLRPVLECWIHAEQNAGTAVTVDQTVDVDQFVPLSSHLYWSANTHSRPNMSASPP